jgi:hypothetical protein
MLSVSEFNRLLENFSLIYGEKVTKTNILLNKNGLIEQKEYESTLLNKHKICKILNSDSYRKLESLDKNKIIKLLTNDFYDVSLMEEFRCLLNLILDGEDGSKTERESFRERIHEYISNITKFGEKSNNEVFKTSISSDKYFHNLYEMFVIKSTLNVDESSTLLHEAIVGLEGLNSLRTLCPNFCYVYDSFKCECPSVHGDNKVVQYCVDDNIEKVNYTLYELIDNSIPINKIKSAEDLILVYIQIVISLKIANDKCDFTHYDLHGGNILLRKCSDKIFYIKYSDNERDIYLKSNGIIATFIDYGMSHIKTEDGRNIGVIDEDLDFTSIFIESNKSNIMLDAYKSIVSILSNSENKKVKNMCLKIIGYFFGKDEITEEEGEKIIEVQKRYYFNVPIELTAQWNLIDLFKHCTKIASTIVENSILLEEPPNLFGKDIVYRSTIYKSNFIYSAFDIYNSIGKPEHEIMLHQFDDEIKVRQMFNTEQDKILKYIDYKFEIKYKHLKFNWQYIYDEYFNIIKCLEEFIILLNNINSIKNNIKYLTFSDSFKPGLFLPLINQLNENLIVLQKSMADERDDFLKDFKILSLLSKMVPKEDKKLSYKQFLTLLNNIHTFHIKINKYFKSIN